MRELELLAPARNIDIGIAAIDCGADAVYIAGPEFGARQAAGNSIEDIAKLCNYAHRYGVRIFVTVNTILFDDKVHGNEVERARRLMEEAQDAGVDAFIVQDLATTSFLQEDKAGKKIRIPLHASTQCAIRTPDKAAFLESVGFSRLVLERQLSLEDIRAIHDTVGCELEFFVHGALCVSYSGECYMSEYLTGRSANKGECAQACRSRYDLVDQSGHIICRNKALLSLKDYNLHNRLGDLADAGVTSFKIEGRLKNISYVRNVVRAYSEALDHLVESRKGEYRRSSTGRITGGFTPDLDKTFNRSYTSLYIDGKRGKWASADSPKGNGEEIGKVKSVRKIGSDMMEVTVGSPIPRLVLSNGDGFSVIGKNGMEGFRGDICNGLTIRSRRVDDIQAGQRLFRNLDAQFEKELASSPCKREITVTVNMNVREDKGTYILGCIAESEDGRTVTEEITSSDIAKDYDRMKSLLLSQMTKKSLHYNFVLKDITSSGTGNTLPFLPVSAINGIRRTLAEKLDALPCNMLPLAKGSVSSSKMSDKILNYKANIANPIAQNIVQSRGAEQCAPAYEISHDANAELMRSKYCIRYEMGLCLKQSAGKKSGELFLLNNGRKFPLRFDCAKCEMAVLSPQPIQK